MKDSCTTVHDCWTKNLLKLVHLSVKVKNSDLKFYFFQQKFSKIWNWGWGRFFLVVVLLLSEFLKFQSKYDEILNFFAEKNRNLVGNIRKFRISFLKNKDNTIISLVFFDKIELTSALRLTQFFFFPRRFTAEVEKFEF